MLAWEQRKLRSIDTRTKEGVYNAVLAETDDHELAMKARTEFWTNTKLANLQGAQ